MHEATLARDLVDLLRSHGHPITMKEGWPEWAADFLEALEETRRVSLAAERAGVSRQTAYRFRGSDATFRWAWTKALRH